MSTLTKRRDAADEMDAGAIVDEYLNIKKSIDRERAIAKSRILLLERREAELREKLLSFARDSETTEFAGKDAIAEVLPSTRREIDPRMFLKFLLSEGRKEDFWKYAKVGVTAAEKDFGEKPLSNAGALSVNTTPYARVRVYDRK